MQVVSTTNPFSSPIYIKSVKIRLTANGRRKRVGSGCILDDKLRQAGLIQNLMYQVKSFRALKFPIIEAVVCT